MPSIEEQHRQVLARWTIALCEPLIETDVRVELDQRMEQILDEQAEWMTTWFSGMLASIITSLPSEDPWRNLSASHTGPTQTLTHVAPNVPLPQEDGASTRGRPFGTRRDHTDMTIPDSNDWLVDLQLAAVSKEVDPWSAALIGFAGGGMSPVKSAITSMIESVNSKQQDKKMFPVLSGALKYAIHRRRYYVGYDDSFVWSKGFLWIVRSEQILNGRDFHDENLIADIAESKIADGDYLAFRLQ